MQGVITPLLMSLEDNMKGMKRIRADVGAVGYFPAARVPSGWQPLDGGYLRTNEYPELFDKLGYMYGTLDGGAYFRLPAINGRYNGNSRVRAAVFIRADDTASDDIFPATVKPHTHSATVSQSGAHTHGITLADILGPVSNSALTGRNADNTIENMYSNAGTMIPHAIQHTHGTQTTAVTTGGTVLDVLPRRANMLACIYTGRST